MSLYPPEARAWVLEHDAEGNRVVRPQFSAASAIGWPTELELENQRLRREVADTLAKVVQQPASSGPVKG